MSFNIPQIVSVTSESLQAKIRSLLPSQQGFGADLQASNVIFPVVDLTAAAEGSAVGENLQTALAFGSQTSFSVANSSQVIASSPGFYRIFGCAVSHNSSSAAVSNSLTMTDGSTTKTIWEQKLDPSSNKYGCSNNIDFTVFLASGESVSAVSSNGNSIFIGSSRQIANVNGDLTNPSGFNPQ